MDGTQVSTEERSDTQGKDGTQDGHNSTQKDDTENIGGTKGEDGGMLTEKERIQDRKVRGS